MNRAGPCRASRRAGRHGYRIRADEARPAVAAGEDEWAEELGVSRTVLREATKVLISKRLVESRPRAGTKVRAEVDWNILDPDVRAGGSRQRRASSLSASCSSCAGSWSRAIAARAAEKASEQDIEALTAAYAAMERAVDDSDRFIGPDAEFHKTIVRSVENRMVDALGGVIDAALTLSLKLSLDAPDGQRLLLHLHRKVLDAIRRHDRNGASRAMELLIDNAQQDALGRLAPSLSDHRGSDGAHEHGQEAAAFAGLVRRQRQERLHAPQLDEEPGHARRCLRRPPGDRHLQHLVGTDARATRICAAWPSTSSAASTKPAACRSNSR